MGRPPEGGSEGASLFGLRFPWSRDPVRSAHNCSVDFVNCLGTVDELLPGAVKLGQWVVCLRDGANEPNRIPVIRGTYRAKKYDQLKTCEVSLPSSPGWTVLQGAEGLDRYVFKPRDDLYLKSLGFSRPVNGIETIEILPNKGAPNKFDVELRSPGEFVRDEQIGSFILPPSTPNPTLVQSFCSKDTEYPVSGILVRNGQTIILVARVGDKNVNCEIYGDVDIPLDNANPKKNPNHSELKVTKDGLVFPVRSINPIRRPICIVDFRCNKPYIPGL